MRILIRAPDNRTIVPGFVDTHAHNEPAEAPGVGGN